jgi:hypothetical protein
MRQERRSPVYPVHWDARSPTWQSVCNGHTCNSMASDWLTNSGESDPKARTVWASHIWSSPFHWTTPKKQSRKWGMLPEQLGSWRVPRTWGTYDQWLGCLAVAGTLVRQEAYPNVPEVVDLTVNGTLKFHQRHDTRWWNRRSPEDCCRNLCVPTTLKEALQGQWSPACWLNVNSEAICPDNALK